MGYLFFEFVHTPLVKVGQSFVKLIAQMDRRLNALCWVFGARALMMQWGGTNGVKHCFTPFGRFRFCLRRP